MSTIPGYGNRFSPIDPNTVGMISLVEIPDKEALIIDRMARIKAIWAENDPPMAAQYDVEELEFDPLKIAAESGVAGQINALSLINSMGKVTSLLYAFGEDLDIVASRYPGGVPRIGKGTLQQEKDERYRYRIWASSSAFSTAGAPLAYVFHAMTAVPELRDVTMSTERASLAEGTTIVITCLAERVWRWKGEFVYQPDSPGIGAEMISDSLQPTTEQLLRVRARLTRRDIGPPSDVLSVRGPIEIPVTIDAGVYAYPGNDGEGVRSGADKALQGMIEAQRYLGIDATHLAIDKALSTVVGIQDRELVAPVEESISVPDTAIAKYTLQPTRLLGFDS